MLTLATAGFDSFNKSFLLSDASIVACHIRDTAGQERYKSIGISYYRDADAVLLVYDISERSSFENIKEYFIPHIKEYCKKDIIILLLGNKADKEEKRQVKTEEGINLAMQENYEFKESSCLHNMNVADAFEYLVEKWNLLNKKKEKEINNDNENNGKGNKVKKRKDKKNKNIKIDSKTNQSSQSKGGCC